MAHPETFYTVGSSDPFDRILLAQAESERMKFMTHDTLIPYYNGLFVINV